MTQPGHLFQPGSVPAGGGTPVGGSGTTGILPKFTAASTLGDSVIKEASGNILPVTDNATQLGTAALRLIALYAHNGMLLYAGVSDANAVAQYREDGIYLGAGGASALDWQLLRTGANIAALGANDTLQCATAPSSGNDLVNKTYADTLAPAGVGKACSLGKSSSQNINTATSTQVSFDVTNYAAGITIAAAGPPATIVTAGKYLVIFSVAFTASALGTTREAWIYINGTAVFAYVTYQTPSATRLAAISGSAEFDLAVNDTVGVGVYHDAGVGLTIVGGALGAAGASQLNIRRVAP